MPEIEKKGEILESRETILKKVERIPPDNDEFLELLTLTILDNIIEKENL